MFEFAIHRASDGWDDGCPCEGAYQVEGRRGWFIRFNDMMEVMAFIRRIGYEILISEDCSPEDCRGNSNMEITIYDDYME